MYMYTYADKTLKDAADRARGARIISLAFIRVYYYHMLAFIRVYYYHMLLRH